MKIRPLHDRILVQPILEKEVRKGGIIIPDSAKEKPIEGRVKAVGKGKIGDDGKPVKLEVAPAQGWGQHELASTNHIQGGNLLGGFHWMVQWQQGHHAQLQSRSFRRHSGQQQHRMMASQPPSQVVGH